MKKISPILIAFLFLQLSNFKISAQTASISCPGNKTVNTDPGVCTAIVYNIDPIFSPVTTYVNYTVSPSGETGSGSASGKAFPVGVNKVTYYLPEYPGVTCSFYITVEDHTPPVINCPQNITVACAADVPFPGGATASDGCTSPVDVHFVSDLITNQTCLNRYVINRTYSATDQYGNTSTCTQLITVKDTIPPHFNQLLTPVLNVTCTENIPPLNSYNITSSDNCSEEEDDLIPVTQVKSDSTCPNKYTLTRTWTATDACGNTAKLIQVIHVNDNLPPTFDNPPSSLESHSCASEVPVAPVLRATDNCTNGTATVSLSEVKSDEVCVNKFKLTRTWTATDACGNTATFKQVINVNDNKAPVFETSAPPSPVNVSCEKDIPAAVTQTASDNCGTATINFSEVKSNVQCANRFTLTRKWVATDACGNTAERIQVINVYDNVAPTVKDVSATPIVLWPPNHKMKDVMINYTAVDNCSATATLSVSSNDPINGGSDGDQAPDWEVIDDHHVRLRAEKANNGQARYYNIAIHITDGCNPALDTNVVVVVAHNITDPQTGKPFKIGSTVSFGGVFWDKPGNTHTAKWLLDGSAATNGAVTEPSGNQNGKVNGSYKFTTPGVYKLQMNVTDQTGVTSYANTNNDLDAIVVVYDPNGGYSYGGGWFASQPGALTSNPQAEGKASYGYSVNYRNAAKPKGETQFEFKVGSFEFNALNFDYLVINGAKAQFTGTGKIIGGQSGIGFLMTVIDGALDGTGIDKIRMKIFNRNTGYIYYDNQPGASEVADPVTAVGTNSSIVIQGLDQLTSARSEQQTKENLPIKFGLDAYPNPSSNYFILHLNSSDHKTKMQLQVYDQVGKLVENRDVTSSYLIRMGENYKAGVYFVRLTQGDKHSEVKLIKF